MGRVTVRDVAARAGVSAATASRALAGNPRVSPQLAARVRSASDELGFTANALARALRTRRTDTVGMVVPAINNPYFVGLVEAVEAALAQDGLALILCDSRASAAEEARRVELLLSRLVDGLVIVPHDIAASHDVVARAAATVPTVQVDRVVPGVADSCCTDDAEALRQVVAHLREEGWERFCYVGAEPVSSTARDRLAAFRAEVAGTGCPAPQILLGDYSAAWGSRAGASLVAGGLPDGTAVVCGADVIAFGLLPELARAGFRVGRDVGVVGFDDLPFDQVLTPALTSVRHPMPELARLAVRLLAARADDHDRPLSRHLLAPTLVVRDSSTRKA